MLKTAKLSIFFGLFLFSLVFVQGSSAQAVLPGNTTANQNKEKVKEVNPVAAANRSDKAEVAQNRAGTDAAMIKQNKLSEARLRVCQSRENRISSRFTNLKSLGTRVQQNFDGFAYRVDYYYMNTLVPQGYILEDYDALKAQIMTNQAAVNAALEQVRASGQDFSCDSDDPKAQTDTFRASMQELITANKAYKTSVRAFVSAVRDLAKEAKAATLTVTPEVSPEITPEVTAEAAETPEL